ncbi:NAD-dependent epimerase/dehydratase family protein [Lichenifustis flavocetrariae]|uniref:NAD-dependent epimerase/dehydratase family protein n=1 Tax=Lichenifustis flavocetrariae TaxID=2949735 RepID=A0AA42CLT2_9HYPH|nr:NAD-dependent epimerase/dehydratase family protein [Lichenifustis flavocetrariae]MCW6507712.1 NAD-dependent epimerase/dehydratase family protein [Lichenifustis flavocetrariae]
MTNPILVEDLSRIHAAIGQRDRFDGSTVVMTGCAGFLGFYFMNYLVRYADELGIKKVIGLDTFLLDKPAWLTELAERYPAKLDLRHFNIATDDLTTLDGAVDARYVIHGASIASPTFYRQYPVETIDANIWGLRRILDVYRGRDTLKGLLFFSSSEIYGDPSPDAIPTDEEYRGNVSCHGPRACYDESKRFGETMAWVYSRQFGMPITVARPFNNYGPGMRLGDKRLPADFAKCVLENRDIVILSNGAPTRTFCYVSDAITGYLLCLLYGKYDYFNIGIEKPETSVRDLATFYQSSGKPLFGYSGKVIFETSDDPEYMTDNPNRRCPVITKARTVLGYDPTILVEEGVGRYLRFLQHEKA